MEQLTQLFTFENYGELVVLLRNSIVASAVLGMVGGLVGYFVIIRDIPFAVHGSRNCLSLEPRSPCWWALTWYSGRFLVR